MNINATLLGQTLAFVLFVAICWRYVWPPIIAIMEEREKRISDGLEAAKKANDSLEEAKLNYEAELDKAKSESADIVEKANQRASQIISEAKTKALGVVMEYCFMMFFGNDRHMPFHQFIKTTGQRTNGKVRTKHNTIWSELFHHDIRDWANGSCIPIMIKHA